MRKFQKYFKEAMKHLQIADHLTYITFPVLNERRLFLKIFDEIYNSILNCVKGTFHYLSTRGKISKERFIGKDDEELINFFLEKFAKHIGLTSAQIKKIKKILEIKKKRGESVIEFVKKDKVVILGDDLTHEVLDLYRIKDFLLLAKIILMKINEKLKNF